MHLPVSIPTRISTLLFAAALALGVVYIAAPKTVEAVCQVVSYGGVLLLRDPVSPTTACGGFIRQELNEGYSVCDDFTFVCIPNSTSVSTIPVPEDTETGPFTLGATAFCASSSSNRTQINFGWTYPFAGQGYSGGTSALYQDGTRISGPGIQLKAYAWIMNPRRPGSHTYQLRFENVRVPVGRDSFTGNTIYETRDFSSNEVTLEIPDCTPASSPSPTPTPTQTTPPAPVPGSFTVTGATTCTLGNARVSLSWTAASAADYYLIYEYDPAGNQATYTNVGTSYLSTIISNPVNETWTYAVYAINANGQQQANGGSTIPVVVDCPAPPPAAGNFSFSVTTSCSGTVPIATVSWNRSDNAYSYEFLQAHRNNPDVARTGALTSETFSHAFTMVGAVGTEEYFFGSATSTPESGGSLTLATPIAGPGQSVSQFYSGPAGSVVAPVPDCVAPPGNFTVSADAGCQIILNADARKSLFASLIPTASAQSADPQRPVVTVSWTNAARAQRYLIVKISGQTETLVSAGTTLTSIDDTLVTVGQQYSYRIIAVNSGGQTSATSNTVQVDACAAPTPTPTPTETEPENTPPVANDDNETTFRDVVVTIDVLDNDSDAEGPLDIACTSVTQQPAHGSVVISSTDGQATYTPASGYTGTDSFVYQICDQDGLTDTATVTITVLPPPGLPFEPPITRVSVSSSCEGSTPVNVLTWDTVSPSYRVMRDGVELTTLSAMTYTDRTVNAGQSYRYQVITIAPEGVGVGTEETVTTTTCTTPPEASTLSVTGLCSGNAPQHVLTWTAATGATSYAIFRDDVEIGTATVTNFTDDAITTGISYRYRINSINEAGATQSNEVALVAPDCTPETTPPAQQPPEANDDHRATDPGVEVEVEVLDNDSDPDGELNPACVMIVTQPQHGTVVVNPTNGHVTYTPANGFTGTDTFVYEVCDDDGLKDTATVTIDVTPDKENPDAVDDEKETPKDTSTEIDVLSNDRDPDGTLNPTCVAVVDQPENGTTSVNATTGRITYTPSSGFVGTDTFVYEVCDNDGLKDSARVTVRVTEPGAPQRLVSTGIPFFDFLGELWERFLAFLGFGS